MMTFKEVERLYDVSTDAHARVLEIERENKEQHLLGLRREIAAQMAYCHASADYKAAYQAWRTEEAQRNGTVRTEE